MALIPADDGKPPLISEGKPPSNAARGTARSKYANLSPGDKIALYNALLVSVGAVFAAIAWFPDFWSKTESVSSFSIIRDNPSGVLVTRDLGKRSDGSHLYDISYTLTLKNTSNNRFTVALSTDQLFLGKSRLAEIDQGPQTLPDPPNIWNVSRKTNFGVVDWRLAKSAVGVAYGYDQLMIPKLKESGVLSSITGLRVSDVVIDGGMSGRYDPEHISQHTAHYLLAANVEDYAAISVTYARTMWHSRLNLFERSDSADTIFNNANPNFEIVRLRDATDANCSSGITIQNARTSNNCAPEQKQSDSSTIRSGL